MKINCTLVSSWAFARLSTAMAKNTLRSVSGYLWSQEKNKWLINTESILTTAAVFQINVKLSHCQTVTKLTAFGSIKDTVPEESENNEINGGEHSPVNAPLWFDPMIHDCIPILPSQDLQETNRRVFESASAVRVEKEKKTVMELTFTWKTVRIAAGNVSKLVVGVSSSKLNLQGGNKQNVVKLQRHNSHIHSSTYRRMEQLIVLSIRLRHIIPAQYLPNTFELCEWLVCATLWLISGCLFFSNGWAVLMLTFCISFCLLGPNYMPPQCEACR